MKCLPHKLCICAYIKRCQVLTGCARRCSICFTSFRYIHLPEEGWKRDTHLDRVTCRAPAWVCWRWNQTGRFMSDGLLSRHGVIWLWCCQLIPLIVVRSSCNRFIITTVPFLLLLSCNLLPCIYHSKDSLHCLTSVTLVRLGNQLVFHIGGLIC